MAAKHLAIRLMLFMTAAIPLAGCQSSAPPTNPTNTPTASSITISNLASDPTIGQVMQLVASVVLSDGTQKSLANGDVTWFSSDGQVATVSTTGLLTVTGSGEADVKAGYHDITGTVHLVVAKSSSTTPVSPPTFEITGVVHESAPTTEVSLSDVRVEVVGGPLDGQSTTTDRSGRFTLREVSDPGFALKFKKAGYDDLQYDVVALPRDQNPSVGLHPTFAIVHQTFDGTLDPACYAGIPGGSNHGKSVKRAISFFVHHDGEITFQEYLRPKTYSDPGGTSVTLYQGDRLVGVMDNPLDPYSKWPPLEGGFVYRLEQGAIWCQPGPTSLTFRMVFSHPN